MIHFFSESSPNVVKKGLNQLREYVYKWQLAREHICQGGGSRSWMTTEIIMRIQKSHKWTTNIRGVNVENVEPLFSDDDLVAYVTHPYEMTYTISA